MADIIQEPLVEGVYQSLLDYLEISPKADPNSKPVGRYMKNDTFAVFKVFPEDVKGIVWGLVSSNIDGNPIKLVPLRVLNHPKAILLKRFSSINDDLVSAVHQLADSNLLLVAAIRELARK